MTDILSSQAQKVADDIGDAAHRAGVALGVVEKTTKDFVADERRERDEHSRKSWPD